MEFTVKPFSALTAGELYEILRLRSEVFIVEQGGCYLDPDGIDCDSIHIFLGSRPCLGCIRIFRKEDEPGTVQLGRLVVRHRNQGLGRRLMEAAEAEARSRWGAEQLYLTGRADALDFYRKCGWHIEAPGLEDSVVTYYHLRKNL